MLNVHLLGIAQKRWIAMGIMLNSFPSFSCTLCLNRPTASSVRAPPTTLRSTSFGSQAHYLYVAYEVRYSRFARAEYQHSFAVVNIAWIHVPGPLLGFRDGFFLVTVVAHQVIGIGRFK